MSKNHGGKQHKWIGYVLKKQHEAAGEEVSPSPIIKASVTAEKKNKNKIS